MANETEFLFSFETFREIMKHDENNLTSKNPTCFNGWVKVKKYKVTVELINEPKEVLEQRLQELWDNCDNMHHWQPLKKVAGELGYILKGNAGNKLDKNK